MSHDHESTQPQQATAAPEKQEHAEPEQHPMMQKLNWLLGTWIIDGDFYPYGQHFPNRRGLFKFESKCLGRIVTWDICSEGPIHYYEMHTVLGWLQHANAYAGSWSDSMMTICGQAFSNWETEDSLVTAFEAQIQTHLGVVNGMRVTLKKISDKQLTLHSEWKFGDTYKTVILQKGKKLGGGWQDFE